MDWAAGGQQVLDLVLVPRLRRPRIPKLLIRPSMPRPGDQELIKLFADATEQGHGTATAATLAGISGRTADEWIRAGNEELAEHQTQDDPDAELGSHVPFALAHKEAVARFVARNLGVVNESTAGPKGWLPAMTLLERRDPANFARRFEAKVETTIDQHITFSVETLPPARRRALAELALKQLPAPQDVVDGEVVGDPAHQAPDSEPEA